METAAKTIKLYDNDAYIAEFEANVIDCAEENGKYNIILDRTAFSPKKADKLPTQVLSAM